MVDHYASVPAPLYPHRGRTHGRCRQPGGPHATAYNYRDAQYNFLIIGIWTDPAEDPIHIPWVRTLWQALQPFSSGRIYVNYESDVGVDRLQAAYGAAHYERLVALKNTYDPTNMFQLNQNIKPTV